MICSAVIIAFHEDADGREAGAAACDEPRLDDATRRGDTLADEPLRPRS